MAHPRLRRRLRPRIDYDLVVLGGGTAGLVAAVVAAEVGARVALVERAATGGDCLWTGCVPSKALIAAARWARLRLTWCPSSRLAIAATIRVPSVGFSRAVVTIWQSTGSLTSRRACGGHLRGVR